MYKNITIIKSFNIIFFVITLCKSSLMENFMDFFINLLVIIKMIFYWISS